MKRLLPALLCVVLTLTAVGCADKKTIDGTTYDTYGLANQTDKQNPDIEYTISWGNVIWGVVLCETIIAPIYFFGFSLYEPVGKKPAVKGAVPQ